MNEEQLFSQICERCENHAKNMNCEDVNTCPAYKLYLLAKKKRKVVYYITVTICLQITCFIVFYQKVQMICIFN